MRILGLLLLLAAFHLPAAAAPPLPAPTLPDPTLEEPVWVTYTNPRLPFSIVVPASHFYALPAPPAGDGAVFVALDGSAEIRVWGAYNVLEQSLAELQEQALGEHAGDRVTYRRQGSDWFVISGFSGQSIFYEKVVLRADLMAGFVMTYPAAGRALFDQLLGSIAAGFRLAP
jgi:hypothetical protein